MKVRVGAAQEPPVAFDPAATTERAIALIEEAGSEDLQLLGFGETWLPGYPFWLSETGGARFDDPDQKACFAHYVNAAIRVDGPELEAIAAACRRAKVAVIMGILERAPTGGSAYASLVPIDPDRGILTPHRKLVPTYEERLAWTPGDGHGLRVHTLNGIEVSALNCWENWMPLARHAMWAQGPSVHVAIWPGSVSLTTDVTRFVAREGRVFVVSAAPTLATTDVEPGFPLRASLDESRVWHEGGSAIASPRGDWVVEPRAGRRGIVAATIDLDEVARERQNFDAAGHYFRPDVFDVRIDRRRGVGATFVDED